MKGRRRRNSNKQNKGENWRKKFNWNKQNKVLLPTWLNKYTYANVLRKSIHHAQNIYFTHSLYLIFQLKGKFHIFNSFGSNVNVSKNPNLNLVFFCLILLFQANLKVYHLSYTSKLSIKHGIIQFYLQDPKHRSTPTGVPIKRCFEKMQQRCRITLLWKCDFNEVVCEFVKTTLPHGRSFFWNTFL